MTKRITDTERDNRARLRELDKKIALSKKLYPEGKKPECNFVVRGNVSQGATGYKRIQKTYPLNQSGWEQLSRVVKGKGVSVLDVSIQCTGPADRHSRRVDLLKCGDGGKRCEFIRHSSGKPGSALSVQSRQARDASGAQSKSHRVSIAGLKSAVRKAKKSR